tara:strand:- start:101 stop:523 length:423 start_codon:yes stop_codon:yes gene_type:complete
MFNFFKKEKDFENNNISIKSLASLLIHAAKIDENYSEKEKKIIKETLTKLGENNSNVDNILKEAEIAEKDSNQILEFTKEAKNLDYKKKVIIIEALWSIIYSDKNADIYESNLMRRLSGLLYLDKKLVGDIKEKIKNKKL